MTVQLSLDEKYLAAHSSDSNISETTTRYMQRSSAMRFKESAFVMITCEDDHEMEIVEELESISEVKEIQHTYGNYDVVIKIETDSAESLKHVIDLKIRKILHIRATTTLISSPMLVF